VVTSTLVSEGDGLWREYVGDVQDWLTQSARAQELQRQRASAAPAVTAEPAPAPSAEVEPPAQAPVAKRKLSYKEQREFDALPTQIKALEKEQAEINLALGDGQLFASDAARATQLSARHAEIEEEWMLALERWEALGGT
jgi:ABC transport system ATP-binding/permease protein